MQGIYKVSSHAPNRTTYSVYLHTNVSSVKAAFGKPFNVQQSALNCMRWKRDKARIHERRKGKLRKIVRT